MWLELVIEINEEGFAIARLDEAIRVAIKLFFQWLALNEANDVVCQRLALKVRHGTCLGCWNIGGISDDKDVGILEGLKGVFVSRDEIEVISQA